MPQHIFSTRLRWRAPAAALLAVLSTAALAPAARAAEPRATHIVQLRPGVSAGNGRAVVRHAGGRVISTLPIINGVAARMDRREAAAVAHDPRVKAVTANAAVHPKSIDASRLATTYPVTVGANRLWGDATGRGVGVAVIDTGIAGQLPDFKAADGSSRVVATAVTNPRATSAADTYGHGTHVAGIIAGDGTLRAASDPQAGRYIGVAPEANLVSVKVSDDAGVATVLDVIYGLQFVVDHEADFNIRVVNLSLESTVQQSYKTDPLDAAVESAWFHGIVVVAAAGNHGQTEAAANYAPGNDPFVITVGALDDRGTARLDDDVMANWSSAGRTQDGYAKPEVLAPGTRIVSTLAPGSAFTTLCRRCIVGDYIRAGGTSMAAPVIAGAAALALEEHPGWSPDTVKAELVRTARRIGNGLRAADLVAAALDSSIDTNAQRFPANSLVNPATGAIDYSRSTWSRSTWSSASDPGVAGWSRSTWSCTCGAGDGAVDPTRSTWSRSTWSTRWGS